MAHLDLGSGANLSLVLKLKQAKCDHRIEVSHLVAQSTRFWGRPLIVRGEFGNNVAVFSSSSHLSKYTCWDGEVDGNLWILGQNDNNTCLYHRILAPCTFIIQRAIFISKCFIESH